MDAYGIIWLDSGERVLMTDYQMRTNDCILEAERKAEEAPYLMQQRLLKAGLKPVNLSMCRGTTVSATMNNLTADLVMYFEGESADSEEGRETGEYCDFTEYGIYKEDQNEEEETNLKQMGKELMSEEAEEKISARSTEGSAMNTCDTSRESRALRKSTARGSQIFWNMSSTTHVSNTQASPQQTPKPNVSARETSCWCGSVAT